MPDYQRYILSFRRVVRDQDGRRYVDVTSDALEEEGMLALLPLVVVKGEPKSATSNVANAMSAVTTPTASDLRDLLSEADAILFDSSVAASSRMKASSSSSVRGSKVSSKTGRSITGGVYGSDLNGSNSFVSKLTTLEKASAIFLSLSVIALSFALGMNMG